MTHHIKYLASGRPGCLGRIRLGAVVALGSLTMALLFPVAHAQNKEPMPAMQGGMHTPSAMASGGMDMKEMMKGMSGKMSSMPMTGNPDVDFAMMMRIHHEGAIDMANAQLSGGKDPKMKKMAKNIIAAQKKEIAQFDAYLAANRQTSEKMKK